MLKVCDFALTLAFFIRFFERTINAVFIMAQSAMQLLESWDLRLSLSCLPTSACLPLESQAKS